MRTHLHQPGYATGRATARRLDTGIGAALDPLSFASAQESAREYDETLTIVQSIPIFDTAMDLYACMKDAYDNSEYFRINHGAVVLICGRVQQQLYFVDLSSASPSLDSTEQYAVLTRATFQPTRATTGKITELQKSLIKHLQHSLQFAAGTAAPVRAVAVATDEDVGDLNRTTATPATSVEAIAVPIGRLGSDTAITDMHRADADAEIAEAALAAGPLSSLTNTPDTTPQKRKRHQFAKKTLCGTETDTDDTDDTTTTVTASTEGNTFLEQQRAFLTQRNFFWNQQVQVCSENKKKLIGRVKRIRGMIQREEQRHAEAQQRHAQRKSQLDSTLKAVQQEQEASNHRFLTAKRMVSEGSQRVRVITMEIDQSKRTRKTQSEKIANAQKQMQTKLLEQQRAMQTKLQEQQALMQQKFQEQQALMQQEMKQTFKQFIHQ